MTPEDWKDYEAFIEGITFFGNMTPHQMLDHMRQNKEDAFSRIRHFDGQGFAPCTRKGMNHLRALVRRRIKSMDGGKNFDPEEVLRNVTDSIGSAFKQGVGGEKTDEEIFECVWSSAVRASESLRTQSVYHFPCVLAGAKNPGEFDIGPVRFTISSLFESRLAALGPVKIQFSENVRSDDFLSYIRQFGWIASVRVPPCSTSISKARAELAARTAINIVRVWFGLHRGRRMRLVHREPAVSGFTKYLVETDKEILFSWSRAWEGVAVVEGWFSQVDGEHHKLAAWLLRDIVVDERIEIAERLIDALSWFGDAAFEPSPGAKIAKFVMLLERLTATTKKFSKRRFCRRVAILAMDDSDFAAKYWAAYDFYNARSDISHGAASQASDEHWKALRDAEPLITNSIFKAMEVFSILKFGRPTQPKSLEAFFDQQENLWLSTTRQLDAELKTKDKERGF